MSTLPPSEPLESEPSASLLVADEGTAGVVAPAEPGAGSLVGLPELHVAPPVAESGAVILAVDSPWSCDVFNPSLAGCAPITRRGTSVSSVLADQVISIGVASGITIVKR